jgi:glycosyltransferase involved in cell wall biosynthesis
MFRSDCMNSKLRSSLNDAKIHSASIMFKSLIDLAEYFSYKSQFSAAAVCAQIAAQYALVNHTGTFISPQLERILLRIGSNGIHVALRSRTFPPHYGLPKHVLHVLTVSRDIGGHSRFVWRWIQQDVERRHSIVITRQQNYDVPRALSEVVSLTGGKLYLLNSINLDPIAQAQALREISECADLIVLHSSASDVASVIAFANKTNMPPVIFVAHADHAFWLGVNIYDVVVHLRECGSYLSEKRRGIKKERIAFLPIPLPPASQMIPRSEAKRRIGFSEDTVIMLSIARALKYMAITGPSFVEAITPVLESYKNAVLLVIGPENRDQWAEAYQRTQGRIRALGQRSDTVPFYEAADIYVDSFPFTSNTSLLEAGSYGIPLVSFCPHSEGAEVLCPGAPGLTNTLIRITDAKRYGDVISELIEDAELRLRIGETTRKEILAIHSGRGWHDQLQKLYLKALTISPHATLPETTDQELVGELDVLLSRLYPDYLGDLGSMIDGFAEPLPYSVRFRLLAQMLRLNRSFSFSMFLPPRLEAMVEGRMSWWRNLPIVTHWLHDK